MKTKNILYALFASLTLCVSCSDDEDKPRTSLEFPQGTESSVNLSYDQDEFSIPFITEEEWTASVITEESTWIRIPVEKGIGNHELKVLVDPNTSRDRRSGQIEISNGIQTLSYTVSQGTLFEGNDENTEINYAAFGKRNVPLGFGIRVKKSSKKDLLPTKQIMDFVHWEKLNDADKRLAKMTSEEYLGQAKVPDTKIVLTTAKDYAAPSQSINATLKVTIGFGLSKIGLDGGFSLNRKSTDESYAYRAATTVPFWVYGVDDYDGYMKSATALDPNNEKQREIRDQVLGGDFADLYDQMVRCFGNGGTVQDEKGLNEALRSLDEEFGPVFCSSCTTGGSINLEITANMEEGTDTMKINGSLSVGLNFAFSFDAEASASYIKSATDSLTQLQVDANIKGGSFESHDNILVATQSVLKDPTDVKANTAALLGSITEWRKTFQDNKGDEYGNTTLTEFELTGIWEVFKHRDPSIQKAMQERIKKYMKEQYPNEERVVNDENGKPTVVVTCPYLVDIQELAK